jgi:hypothetical protein
VCAQCALTLSLFFPTNDCIGKTLAAAAKTSPRLSTPPPPPPEEAVSRPTAPPCCSGLAGFGADARH